MIAVIATEKPMESSRSASSSTSSSTRFSTITLERVMTSLRRPGVPMSTLEPLCRRRVAGRGERARWVSG